jgi:type VI secretion system secreted protein Hcp
MGRSGVDLPRSAQPVALELRADGVLVDGDGVAGLPGEDVTIECLSFSVSQDAALARGSGMPTGRRSYEPIAVRKRIDRTTPLIVRALVLKQEIDAVFRFYRPTSSGNVEHFFTIEIDQAAVASTSQFSPDGLSFPGAPPAVSALEDVSFAFQQIRWRYEDGGIEAEDDVS